MKQIKLLAIFAILILPSSISYKQPFHYYSYKEMEEFLNEISRILGLVQEGKGKGKDM